MKLIKLFGFTVILSFLGSPIFGKPASDEQLVLANQLYTNHQYEAAKELYENLILRGYSSSDLHYNTGNAYYRLNRIGKAILHYEKAIKLNPHNQDAHFNLKIANLKVASKIVPLSDFFIVKWVKGILQIFEFDSWAIAQIIFGFIMLIALCLYLFNSSSSMQKFGFYTGVLCLVFMLFCSIFAWIEKSSLHAHHYGIILADSYSLRSEPSEKSKEILLVREGVKFVRLETIGRWNQIQLSDGNIGWIEKSAFEMI
jgi:tetratricopeptide (TPR) repeat protein